MVWSSEQVQSYEDKFKHCTEYIGSNRIREKIEGAILEDEFRRVKDKLNTHCQRLKKMKNNR